MHRAGDWRRSDERLRLSSSDAAARWRVSLAEAIYRAGRQKAIPTPRE